MVDCLEGIEGNDKSFSQTNNFYKKKEGRDWNKAKRSTFIHNLFNNNQQMSSSNPQKKFWNSLIINF